MSPILKRDIHEQLKHAKRLALAAAGRSSGDERYDQQHQNEYDWEDGHGDVARTAAASASRSSIHLGPKREISYASGSNPRQGIGVDDIGGDPIAGEWREPMASDSGLAVGRRKSLPINTTWDGASDIYGYSDVRAQEEDSLVKHPGYSDTGVYPPSMGQLELHHDHTGRDGLHRVSSQLADDSHGPANKLVDLRNLLFESTPSLLVLIVALVFTGQLLEHLARWRVFLRVDELFILVPMLGNLKGNLEMCLSARLGTSANIGELDGRRSRRRLLSANLTLLGLQALLISCLAAIISFVLGLLTIHRLGDIDNVPAQAGDGMGGAVFTEPGLGAGDDSEWHEGYTRPGFKQLMMVLATGMGSAGLSSAVLGSFMSSVIVLCRWGGLDPGDLLTLFILALLGAALVNVMDSPIPLIAVILMSCAAAWFTRKVLQDEWVRNVAKGGWTPLIAAMLISSGTGMSLEKGVGKYRGFALLAIPMTGLTGAVGAINANRLSTALHTGHHPAALHPRPNKGLSPLHNAITMFIIAFPCQAAFLGCATWWGWIDVELGLAGWTCFAVTSAFSLCLSHWMTLFFWSKDLDPDSYTLPLHSALVDFIGQCLLMLAYEVCIARGMDVQIAPVMAG